MRIDLYAHKQLDLRRALKLYSSCWVLMGLLQAFWKAVHGKHGL